MLPRVGPLIYVVRSAQVPLAPGASVVLDGKGTNPQPFRWPRDVFATAIQCFSADGDPTKTAALSLRIQDETFQDMFSDGQGGSFAVGGLLLGGGPLPGAGAPSTGARPFPVQRPIARGDQWVITVTNTDPARTITPILGFRFEEAYEGDDLESLSYSLSYLPGT